MKHKFIQRAAFSAVLGAIAIPVFGPCQNAAARPPATNGKGTATPKAPTARCVIAAITTVPMDTLLYSDSSGSYAVARFTGALIGVTASVYDSKVTRRIHVHTGNGKNGVHATGWVDPEALPVYLRETAAVNAGHVWINAGERVSIANVDGPKLSVSRSPSAPLQGDFVANSRCVALSLNPLVPSRLPIAGSATPYIVDKDSITLLKGPNQNTDVVTTLKLSDKALVWGTKVEDYFVRVRFNGPIGVEGWARLDDVHEVSEDVAYNLLPRIPMAQLKPEQLRIIPPPTSLIVVAQKVVALRPGPAAAPVAFVEPGMQIVVLARTDKWAIVLPRSMELAPIRGEKFYADLKSLGMK